MYFMTWVFLSLMDLEVEVTLQAIFPGIFKTDAEAI